MREENPLADGMALPFKYGCTIHLLNSFGREMNNGYFERANVSSFTLSFYVELDSISLVILFVNPGYTEMFVILSAGTKE